MISILFPFMDKVCLGHGCFIQALKLPMNFSTQNHLYPTNQAKSLITFLKASFSSTKLNAHRKVGFWWIKISLSYCNICANPKEELGTPGKGFKKRLHIWLDKGTRSLLSQEFDEIFAWQICNNKKISTSTIYHVLHCTKCRVL